MKVSDRKCGSVHKAFTAKELEELDRCRTTRHGNPIKVSPLKGMTSFPSHPAIGQDARAVYFVE